MAEISKGWRPDPDNPRFFRWHDGKDFTDHTSQVDPSNPPCQGWYPDPDDPTTDMMRYWNGQRWTEKRAPLDPEATVKYKLTAEEHKQRERVSEARWRGLGLTGWLLGLMFSMIVIAVLLLLLVIGVLSGGDDQEKSAGESIVATSGCGVAELDLAPGAPDPCANTTLLGTNAQTSPPSETTTAASVPPDTGAAVSEFISGRILDPGPIDWAISYDYRILDNHLMFSILPGEESEPVSVIGYGEVVQRREYEAEQPFPDSDKVGTVRRLFTAVTVFDFVGTWDGNDPGQVEGTVVWNVPADRLDVGYNESTVGTYPLTDGIFTGPGPPGGVFTATYSPTTGLIEGEATVEPWGVLEFQAVAYLVES